MRPHHSLGHSLFLVVLLYPLQKACAWDDHFRLTHAALESQIPVTLMVPYQPLKEATSLIAELKIHKGWAFPAKLNERVGATISALEVVSKYSDEPDWGVDQNLFEPDQYPELWNPDLSFITVPKGPKSQGFRHMYFPGKFLWSEPMGSFQIPMRPLGEGPRRAELFFQISKRFFQSGQPYWGYRFLGWSLHFMQDLFQPYHARQTPSKRLICFQWTPPFLDIPASAETIGYYHYSYEKWINRSLQQPNSTLAKALHGENRFETFSEPLAEFVISEIVDFSGKRAGTVGKLSLRNFPRFDPKGGRNAEEEVKTDAWKEATSHSTPGFIRMMKITEALFSKMAAITRRVAFEATRTTH